MPRLHLLGHPRLFDANGERVPLSSKKAIAVLGLLATASDGVRSRAWLQQKLWGSRDLTQAQNSLRRELANMRKTLACVPLISDQRSIRLDFDAIWVDVHEQRNDTAPDGGEFLEGLDIAGEEDFEEWLRDARSQFSAENFARTPSNGGGANGGGSNGGSANGGPQPAVPQPREAGDRARLSPAVTVIPLAETPLPPQQRSIIRLVAQYLIGGLSRLRWLAVIDASTAPASQGNGGGDGQGESARNEGDPRFVLHVTLLDEANPLVVLTCQEADRRQIVWSESFALPRHVTSRELALSAGRMINALEEALLARCLLYTGPGGNGAGDGGGADARLRLHYMLRCPYSPADLGDARRLLDGIGAEGGDPGDDLDIFRAVQAARTHWWTGNADALVHAEPLSARALARHSANPKALVVAGMVRKWSGDLDAAAHLFERAMNLQPGCAHACANLGAIHLLRGDTVHARNLLRTAEAMAPFDPGIFWIHGHLAACSLLGGDQDTALRKARDAAALQPNYVLARLVEINCLLVRGDTFTARAAFARSGLSNEAMVTHALRLMPFVDDRARALLRAGYDALRD